MTAVRLVLLVLAAQLPLAGVLLRHAAGRRRSAARQERASAVLREVGDAFVAMDDAGRVCAWDRRAEELYGWTASAALGRDLADLVVLEGDLPAFAAHLRRTPDEGGREVVEVHQRRRDGTVFAAELTTWTTVSAGRTVHSTLVRDVTARCEHEASLARARDEALSAARLKSAFVANTSHEVRTPLHGVVGMATLLRATDLDPRQRLYVDTLAASAEALARVVDDVLDFSRLEAGELVVETADVEVAGLAAEAVALFGPAAALKGLTLDVVVGKGVPPVVRTDGPRLRQVLTGLVGNAVKFTATGSVVLDVALDGPPDADGVPLRLTVRDTGPGIADADRERLFEPFAQADTSSTRRHGGTGLGLALSSRLVALLGGELTLTSEPGRGCAVSVRLVLARGEHRAAPEPVVARAPLPRRRLLVAEDSPVNQLVVVELLQLAGYDADVAADGEQAVRMLEQGGYDLVLMDCQMPVLDGFGATARIRALPSPLSGVPVVALTASALVEDRASCLAAGMDDFLAKPLRLEALEEVLGRVLARA